MPVVTTIYGGAPVQRSFKSGGMMFYFFWNSLKLDNCEDPLVHLETNWKVSENHLKSPTYLERG